MEFQYNDACKETMKQCKECKSQDDLTQFNSQKPPKSFWMCAVCLADIEAETQAQMKEDMAEYWNMIGKGLDFSKEKQY